MTIGHRLGHNLGANNAAGASPIVHDDLLLPFFSQSGRDRARQDVKPAAGSRWHNDAYWTRWEFLGARRARRGCDERSSEQPSIEFHHHDLVRTSGRIRSNGQRVVVGADSPRVERVAPAFFRVDQRAVQTFFQFVEFIQPEQLAAID